MVNSKTKVENNVLETPLSTSNNPKELLKTQFRKSIYANYGTQLNTVKYRYINEGDQEPYYVYRSAVKVSSAQWVLVDGRHADDQGVDKAALKIGLVGGEIISRDNTRLFNFHEVLQKLAEYEVTREMMNHEFASTQDEKRHKGQIDRKDYTYFRNFARREGLLFDEVTGEVIPTINGAVIFEGDYRQKDIEELSNQSRVFNIRPSTKLVDLVVGEEKTSPLQGFIEQNKAINAIAKFSQTLKLVSTVVTKAMLYDRKTYVEDMQIAAKESQDQKKKGRITKLLEIVDIAEDHKFFEFIIRYGRNEKTRKQDKRTIGQLKNIYKNQISRLNDEKYGEIKQAMQEIIDEMELLMILLGGKLFVNHLIEKKMSLNSQKELNDKDLEMQEASEAELSRVVEEMRAAYRKQGASEEQINGLDHYIFSDMPAFEFYDQLIQKQSAMMIQNGQDLTQNMTEEERAQIALPPIAGDKTSNGTTVSVPIAGYHLLQNIQAYVNDLQRKAHEKQAQVTAEIKRKSPYAGFSL